MATPENTSLIEVAKQWLKDNVDGASIDLEKINERRINVVSLYCSFYIVLPHHSGQQWTVWSNDSDTANKISNNLDYLTSPSRTITEILSKTLELLNKNVSDSEEEEEEEEEEGEEEEEEEEEEDIYDGYYDMDEDIEKEEVKEKEKFDDEMSADDFFTGDGSPAAVHRLLSDLKNMNKSAGKFGISGHPRGDNLFIWDVELFDFDSKSLLYKDLEAYAKRHNRKPVVDLEMKFPKDYPMNPPFVRVLRPKFQFLTGHVTIGGSVCMQMLTRSGWSPSNDIESILIQVRAEIMSDPKARLDLLSHGDYSESEARQAFERMVQRYGWNR